MGKQQQQDVAMAKPDEPLSIPSTYTHEERRPQLDLGALNARH